MPTRPADEAADETASDAIAARKRALRVALRTRRAAIEHRPQRSAELWAKVVQHPAWVGSGAVMAYLSFGTEPDTRPLLDATLASGRQLLVPRVEGDHLVAVPYEPGAAIEESGFGVPEPTAPAGDRTDVEIVIVPGLAFTSDGRRLGYGKGFYDRFLASLPTTTVTVGACFAEMLAPDLPTDHFDQRVQHVVTD